MGRPRSPGLAWLPPHCYPDRGRIVYKKGCKPVRLCSESEATYDLVVKRLAEHLNNRPDTTKLRWLCERFNESAQFKKLSPATRKAYEIHCRTILNFQGKGGKLMGDASFSSITTGLLQRYLDRRAEQGAPVSGNREICGYLSKVYSWAGARDKLPKGMQNPCIGVERNTESARDRYVEDWEFDFALARAKPLLALWMQMTYLLAGRPSEPLKLTKRALTDEGVRVERLKGSKTNVVRWRPEGAPTNSYSWLEDVVNQALALPCRVSTVYLLHDEDGQPLKYSRIRSMWDDMMELCAKDSEAEGIVWTPFKRHDLKRKGVSDHESGTVGGHKTEQMRNRYRVREDIEEPVR